MRANLAWVCGANNCATPYDSFDLLQWKGRETTAFLVRFLEETLTSLVSQRSRYNYMYFLPSILVFLL